MASTKRTLLLSSLSIFLFINQILVESKLISIKTPEDLVKFSNEVNDGDEIFRGTVVLENDLDMINFSSSFKPISFNQSRKAFSGEFDGKGHIISNLNLTYENDVYVGLFGISSGMTMKSLVLDKSCTISGSVEYLMTSSKESFGAFVGACFSDDDGCVFQGLINMATLSANNYNYVGGIVGSISSTKSGSRIVNCLNFGDININGYINKTAGGIVGFSKSTDAKVQVQNCANYGYINQPFSLGFLAHTASALLSEYSGLSGLSIHMTIGGIAGEVAGVISIKNCLNVGGIVYNVNLISANIVGKIGNVNKIKIENSYWLGGICDNKDVGESYVESARGFIKESGTFSKSLKLDNPVAVNAEEKENVVDALNALNSGKYEKWMILDLNGGNIIKGESLYKVPTFKNRNALPNPVKEGFVFRGWYLDPEFKTKFNPVEDNVSDVDVLYAKWANPIKVSFIFGTEKTEINITSDDVIEFPEVEVSRGHKGEWCTIKKEVCNPVTSEKDIELHLVQTPKEYTLSFNTNGGEEIEPKTIVFGEVIGELPVPAKEGCEFLGWFADPELKNSFYPEKMPGYDVCLYAKWKGASGEGKTFARFTTFACIALSVAGTWVVFGKRSIIGLKN